MRNQTAFPLPFSTNSFFDTLPTETIDIAQYLHCFSNKRITVVADIRKIIRRTFHTIRRILHFNSVIIFIELHRCIGFIITMHNSIIKDACSPIWIFENVSSRRTLAGMGRFVQYWFQ